MYVDLDATSLPATATLAEPDDFKAFKLVVAGAEGDDALTAALEGLGRLDGDHAWLSIDAVKALPGARAGDGAWAEQWDGMIGYAATKGWISPDGAEVQAHVERAA